MPARTSPPIRNRRDIGEVLFPIEKIMRARELSSSCIGVEAMLEADRSPEGVLTRAAARSVRSEHHKPPRVRAVLHTVLSAVRSWNRDVRRRLSR